MKSELKLKLWRLFLRAVRAVTLTVDDWVQAQELKLREPAVRAAAQVEVDPVASALREKALRASSPEKALRRESLLGGTVPAVNGARHSRRAGAPRLRYQAGQFVRVGGAA